MWNFDFSLRRQIATWKKWKDQNANGRNWIQASLGPIVFKCKMRGRNEKKELDWSWPSETSMMEQKKVTFWFLFTLQCFIHVSLSFLHFFEMYDDSWLHAMDVKRYWVRICRPLRQWRLNKNKEKRLVTSKANYEFNFKFESKENVLWIINGKRKKEWYVLKQTKYCGSSVDRTWLRDSFLAPIVGWLV